MLTVCAMQSQDTISSNNWNLEFKNWDFPLDTTDLRPVSFPFWMAQAIALDLEEKFRLEQEAQLLVLEKETLEHLVKGLKQKDQDRLLQLQLSDKNRKLLEVQLQAEREIKKEDGWMLWALRLLGALGAGFLLGRI